MRFIPLAALGLILASPAACAQPAPATAGPRLIVVISVDQLSGPLFDEYRPNFTGGLARLAQGAVYRNGFQSHAATETCPGHSTILTGNRPAKTGIVGNTWIDQSTPRPDKRIYCAEDESAPGTSSTDYRVSDKHLQVPTLGELMKQRWSGSRNVAVAGKDRAAVMMSGHRVDQRWFWGGSSFVSDLNSSQPPAVVAKVNEQVAKQIATAQPELSAPGYCTAKAKPVSLGDGLSVGTKAFARAAGDAGAYKNSPEADGAVLALAAGLIQDMKLGRGEAPDLLSIGLSSTDYVGHSYGSGGLEMCLSLTSLDRDLGDFLRFLDSTGVDYALVLTADHGALDIPERLAANGVAGAARVDPGVTASAIGAQVAGQLGLSGPVLLGDVSGDVYVDAAIPQADRQRVIDAAVAAYKAKPQVETVLTRKDIEGAPDPSGPPSRWSLAQRVKASYDPERSGDLYVILKQNVLAIAKPTAGYVSGHGSVWDYDRRVPIIFWRRPQMPAASEEEIETVDIMPTLAALLGIELTPAMADGKCVPAFAKVACPTR